MLMSLKLRDDGATTATSTSSSTSSTVLSTTTFTLKLGLLKCDFILRGRSYNERATQKRLLLMKVPCSKTFFYNNLLFKGKICTKQQTFFPLNKYIRPMQETLCYIVRPFSQFFYFFLIFFFIFNFFFFTSQHTID